MDILSTELPFVIAKEKTFFIQIKLIEAIKIT